MRETTPAHNSTRRGAAALAALLFLAAVAAASLRLVGPPPAVGADAPPADFSSARAMRHLREIARRPHPTGTEENARVRRYLVEQLSALGFAAEVHSAEVVLGPPASGGPAAAARVENVLARLPGTANSRALVLAAHYDSVPTAPGASDDGAGTAALLETARALRTGPPLANDLILLITDGEELNLLGAEAFAREHPWMREVGLVLNFEGRGAGGPSMMFETSDGNGPLVEALGESAPHPIANSLMYAVYRRMPNDTDMTVFRRAGAAGLNFAYAARLTHYHTMLDSVEEMDERSLQHHGSYALALARRFGREDLRETRGADAVYFNPLGPFLVCYPEAWVWPSTLALAALFAGVVVYGIRRGRLSLKGLAAGFAAWLAAAVAAGLLTAGVWRAARSLHAGFESLPWRTPYGLWLYAAGLVLLALGAGWVVYALPFRGTRAENLWAGALAWWLLLLLVTAFALPLGSFLYAWPLAFALAGLWAVLASRGAGTFTAKNIFVVAASAAPGVALVAPLVYMFFMMLGLGLIGFFSVMPLLTLGLCVPLLRQAGAGRWLMPAVVLVAGFAFVAAAVSTAGFDARRRKANSVFYFLDADANRARFVSADAAPDEWTSQFVGPGARREGLDTVFPWLRQSGWAGEAPPASLPAPGVEVLEDSAGRGARRLRLRLTSPRGAPMLVAHTEPPLAVRRALVNGRPVFENGRAGPGGPGLRLSYAAPPREGIELLLEVEPASPVRLVVQDVSYALPEIPGRTFAPRPAHMMPVPAYRTSDTTIVRKTFEQ
ncbi:MAG TPA: M28 family peptidase [Pyrinomonadaceae bacterium]|nr:M28 family peptidase [Pyrinomonadaceae bacterium]